jgi:large subunit ribosomal protein L25
VELTITGRDTAGKNANRRTRSVGSTPAVIYGNERTPRSVQIDSHALSTVLGRLAGRSTIFSLLEEGAKEPAIALLREVQRHPVTDEILHVDLFEIPRGEPIEVRVGLELVGESAAVKRGEATLEHVATALDIRCLPRDLPEVITVDVSSLKVHDKIFVRDIAVAVGEVVTDPDQLVVVAKPPTVFVEETEAEEEEAAAEAAEDAAEGEGKDESKEDED